MNAVEEKDLYERLEQAWSRVPEHEEDDFLEMIRSVAGGERTVQRWLREKQLLIRQEQMVRSGDDPDIPDECTVARALAGAVHQEMAIAGDILVSGDENAPGGYVTIERVLSVVTGHFTVQLNNGQTYRVTVERSRG